MSSEVRRRIHDVVRRRIHDVVRRRIHDVVIMRGAELHKTCGSQRCF
jgi:hypothetical protein